MRVADAWALLGLEPTDDARAVKRAYGRLLKQIDVEGDPDAFIRLHRARDLALSWGTVAPDWESDDEYEEDWPSEPLDAAPDESEPLPPLESPDEYRGIVPPPFVWRPELPAGECDRLAALRRDLDGLLFAEPPPEAERITAVGNELIHACASASVDDVTATERWLLATLAAAIPRSDPLIEPAMRHFRWDTDLRPQDFDFEYDLGALQQRFADRAAMAAIGPLHPDRRALEELGRPGRTRLGPFELSLARDVRSFFDETLRAHPTLEHDLDPEALAWWQAYFRRRHLPGSFWLQLLAIPPFLTFAGALLVAQAKLSLPLSIVTGYLAALGATLLAILALAELRARRAAREEHWRDHGYSSRKAEQWLLAALLLPLAAGLVAFSIWTAILWSLTAMIVAVGGYLETRTPPRQLGAESLFIPGFPVMASVAGLAVLLIVPPSPAAHLAGPLAALCFLGYRGHEAAAISLDALPARLVLTIRAVAAMLLAAALVLLFAFLPSLPPPAALTLVPVAIALQHLATANVFLATTGVEWAVRVAAIIFYLTVAARLFGDRSTGFAAALLLYALLYALLRIGLAINRPKEGARPIDLF